MSTIPSPPVSSPDSSAAGRGEQSQFGRFSDIVAASGADPSAYMVRVFRRVPGVKTLSAVMTLPYSEFDEGRVVAQVTRIGAGEYPVQLWRDGIKGIQANACIVIDPETAAAARAESTPQRVVDPDDMRDRLRALLREERQALMPDGSSQGITLRDLLPLLRPESGGGGIRLADVIALAQVVLPLLVRRTPAGEIIETVRAVREISAESGGGMGEVGEIVGLLRGLVGGPQTPPAPTAPPAAAPPSPAASAPLAPPAPVVAMSGHERMLAALLALHDAGVTPPSAAAVLLDVAERSGLVVPVTSAADLVGAITQGASITPTQSAWLMQVAREVVDLLQENTDESTAAQ